MKRQNHIIAYYLSVIYLAFITSTPAFAEDYSKIVEQNMPSIVFIQLMDEDKDVRSTGTGFSIGKNRIITCWHVIDDTAATIASAKTKDGKSFKITQVLASSAKNDLVILEHDGDAIPALRIAHDEPKQGSPAIVIGCPRTFTFSVSDGIVSSWRKNREAAGRSEVQFTSPVSPGNSGGPVFGRDGRVFGVVSWGRVDKGSQNLNFAISFEHIDELISAIGKEKPTDFSKREQVERPPQKRADIPQDDLPSYKDLAQSYMKQKIEFVPGESIRITNEQRELAELRRSTKDREERASINAKLRGLGIQKANLSKKEFDIPIGVGSKTGSIGKLKRYESNQSILIRKVLTDDSAIVSLVTYVFAYGPNNQVSIEDTIVSPAYFLLEGKDMEDVADGDTLSSEGIFIRLGTIKIPLDDGTVQHIPHFHSIDEKRLNAELDKIDVFQQNRLRDAIEKEED